MYDALDALVDEGRIAAYGVSVETVDEALTAIARPHVATVQIILNVFRRKPLGAGAARGGRAGVGIVARVPLATRPAVREVRRATRRSTRTTTARTTGTGQAFDVGETFAGVPFEVGVAVAREVAGDRPTGASTAQCALRWVIDQPGVSVVIPGARNAEQAGPTRSGRAAARSTRTRSAAARAVYDERIRQHVHARW